MRRSSHASSARRHLLLAGLRVSADQRLPEALRAWLEDEQTLVHRSVDRRLLDPGSVTHVPAVFLPEARTRFVLPSVWLPAADGVGRAPRGFVRTRRGRREWLYVWHPANDGLIQRVVRGAEPGPKFFGAVTSSVRTMLLWPAEDCPVAPFFAKLSLPLEVAGAPRVVDAQHVHDAVAASELVGQLRAPVTFVREPFGVVPRKGADLSFLVREIPAGRWRPFFAYTSRESSRRRESAMLLDRLVDAWLGVAEEFGLALEAHAQNVLVEIGVNGRPTGRLGFRDLDGVSIDPNVLARRVPRLTRTVDRLVDARSSLFDDPDEALAHGFHRFVLGGPAAGIQGGQRRAVRHLSRLLGVDATRPEEVVAAIHVRRTRRLDVPRPPTWLERFIRREQGPNDRTREPRFFAPVDHSALPAAYDPARHPRWPVEVLELRKSEVDVLPRRLRSSVQRAPRGAYRLFVHPFMRTRLGLLTLRPFRRTRFFATPTSSPRTLAMWDAAGVAFAVKVSLDVELLGLSRLVHGSKLRRAVGIDRCLGAIPSSTLRREGVTFLREREALRVRERDDGQLVRSLSPSLGRAEPGFGLFARGGLLDRLPAARSFDAIERWVVAPLARVSAFLFFQEGLLGQLHQQNVLFELGPGGWPNGRLIIRDLDSFEVDPRVRRARGRAVAGVKPRLDVAAAFDRLWGRSCRGDFGFLGRQLLVRRGLGDRLDELYASFDRAFFIEAARHLGAAVVRRELEWSRQRSPVAADRIETADLPVRALLARCSPQTFFLERDRREIGYSVNAMVHGWLATKRQPR